MSFEDFYNYVQELQRYYGQELNETEMNIWYENLKFMTIERFNYIIAEIYKTNKFMPKLSEILDIHKSIGYTENNTSSNIKDCQKCGNTGYIIYTKIIDGRPYQHMAVCDCKRQHSYDGSKCTNPKDKSEYYVPTVSEIGLEVKENKPTKKEVYESMMKLKNSPILPESIKDIIRKEFVKMED